LSIFFTEKASDKVTERGNPSGMATTTTVIPIMRKLKSVLISFPVSHCLEIPLMIENLIRRTIIITIAE
jgi:hypothetical protein